MKKVCLVLCLAFLFALPAMADIIIGNPPNSNNCIPFSCRSIDNGNYEQIYNSPDFSGSINIGSISFYDTLFNNGPNQGVANLNFQLYLATTAQSVPDGTIPNNAVLFGNYSLNGGLFAFDSVLSFTGVPYLYDPTQGNLELILKTSGGSNPNSGVFTQFDFDSGKTGVFSRWCGVCGNGQGFGLVTGFETAVPEPGTLLMMGTGVVGVVGAIRRRLFQPYLLRN